MQHLLQNHGGSPIHQRILLRPVIGLLILAASFACNMPLVQNAITNTPAAASTATTNTPTPPTIVSISICSPTGTSGQGSCPSGTFDTRQVVLGPGGAPLNQHDVGGVTDEHASVLPPGSLQGIKDYLFFVAAGTDVHPHNIGVVALSGGSGPDSKNRWTLDFAPGYGSYKEGHGQVFVAPIDQIQCPKVADPIHQDQTFDLNYAAAGSVVPDPTSGPGNLLMIYEGCNACIGDDGGHRTGEGAYISVGVATSIDSGRTWPTYHAKPTFDFVALPDSSHTQGPGSPRGALGQSVCIGNDCKTRPAASYGRYEVLSPPVSLPWLMESGHPATDAAHDAEPAAFVDDVGSGPDRYIYEVHIYGPGNVASSPDQLLDKRDHDLTMARARLNGGTAPLEFLKWDGQSYSQPGIGGHEVQILPDGSFENCGDPKQDRGQGSISYVKETQQYLLTFVCKSKGDPAGGASGGQPGSAWFYATTGDLSHPQWSTPREIIGSWTLHDTGPNNSYGCPVYPGWYPTFMSLDHKPGNLGLHGYVFSMWGCLSAGDNPPTRKYVSREFSITIR